MVKYDNKRLTINGQPAIYAPQQDYMYVEDTGDAQHPRITYSKQYQETLGSVAHNILNDNDARPMCPVRTIFRSARTALTIRPALPARYLQVTIS